MIKLTLSVPPPSVNAMFSNVPGVGRVSTKTYKTWKRGADWELAAQRPKKIIGAYELRIKIQREWRAKRGRDIDNFIKAISDCLVRVKVVEDDYLAERVSAEWSDEVTGVEIEVFALNEKSQAA